MTEIEKKIKSYRAHRRYCILNKEKIEIYKKEYYAKYREHIILQKRMYRARLSEEKRLEQNRKRKERRYRNIESTRLQGRINYWRRKLRQSFIQPHQQLNLQKIENEITN